MKRLFRSTKNRVIGGVCSGIAEYFNLDPVLVRLIFVALAVFGGAGIILYLIAWIVMPEQGARKNTQNAKVADDIKSSIKEVAEEFEDVAKELKDEFNEIGEEIEKEEKKRTYSSGNWLGIFLVFLGVASLFRMFGWFHFSWYEIWRFWPVFLIIIGISCIRMRGWLKNTLMAIALVGLLVALVCNSHFRRGNFRDHVHTRTVHVSGNIMNVETSRDGNFATLEVDIGASRLNLFETTEHLSEIWFDGERVSFVEFSEGREQNERFRRSANRGVTRTANVDIALNDSPIWDFEFNIGAASANLDLSAFRVREIEINIGAANIDLKIGEKYPRTRIEISTGASNVTVRVPKNADIKVVSTRFLMSKSLDGFVRSGNTHRTENFGSAEQTIMIEVSGAVGSFEVIRY